MPGEAGKLGAAVLVFLKQTQNRKGLESITVRDSPASLVVRRRGDAKRQETGQVYFP